MQQDILYFILSSIFYVLLDVRMIDGVALYVQFEKQIDLINIKPFRLIRS